MRSLDPAPARLPALDGLRGLLAVVVALWHATSPLHVNFFAIPAKFAVCGFFIISGLVLARAWDERPVAFLAQRAVRLWPTYALCLAAGYAFAGLAPHWRQFLFFPLLAPDAEPHIDPPIWSLIVEAWAMPLMPLIVWAARDRRRAAFCFVVVTLIGLWLPDRGVQQLFLALGYFIAGAYLCRCNPRAGWLESAPMQWLGKISYSFYLSHWLVLAAAERLFGPVDALCAMPLAFAVGYAVWAMVERPSVLASRRVKAWFAESRVVAPSPSRAAS